MTTYDQIWQTFLNNIKISDIDLPQTEEKIYETIRNSIMLFNNKMRTEIKADDASEQLDTELSNDYLLLLANFIKLSLFSLYCSS